MRMVDVSGKRKTARIAVAQSEVRCLLSSLKRVKNRETDKGDVLAAARLAGVMAAKRTPDIIPLCHPIALSSVDVDIVLDEGRRCFIVESCVRTVDRTGVEMEALAACAAASLTIYDMLKRYDRGMEITALRLIKKSGGRSGGWSRTSEKT